MSKVKNKQNFSIDFTTSGDEDDDNDIEIHEEVDPLHIDIDDHIDDSEPLLIPSNKQRIIFEDIDRPYACTTCDKKFTRSSHLKRHNLLHSGEKPYECHVCNIRFARAEQRLRHVQDAHKTKPQYKCEECGRLFEQYFHLKIHMNWHLGVKPIKCDICGTAFERSEQLNRHRKRCHNDALVMERNSPTSSLLMSSSSMTQEEIEAVGKYELEKEQRKQLQQQKLKQQQLMEHQNINLIDSNQLLILPKIIRTHKIVPKNICTVCKKEFSRKDHLNRHIMTHYGIKPFKCDSCDKTFSRKDNQLKHKLHCTSVKIKTYINNEFGGNSSNSGGSGAGSVYGSYSGGNRNDEYSPSRSRGGGRTTRNGGISPSGSGSGSGGISGDDSINDTLPVPSNKKKVKMVGRGSRKTLERPFQCEFCPTKFTRIDNRTKHMKTCRQKTAERLAKQTEKEGKKDSFIENEYDYNVLTHFADVAENLVIEQDDDYYDIDDNCNNDYVTLDDLKKINDTNKKVNETINISDDNDNDDDDDDDE